MAQEPRHRGHDPAREFVACALYVDLVILAGLAVVPVTHLPAGPEVAAVILGSAAGLLAAHWLSFRLAVQATTDGTWHAADREAFVAQLAGGLCVALAGAAPFLLLSEPVAVRAAVLLLAAPPAAAGLVIGRLRGRSWPISLGMALVALAAAVAVVVLKARAGH
jgi:hypothetical protein